VCEVACSVSAGATRNLDGAQLPVQLVQDFAHCTADAVSKQPTLHTDNNFGIIMLRNIPRVLLESKTWPETCTSASVCFLARWNLSPLFGDLDLA
jgi:hypothetical protein